MKNSLKFFLIVFFSFYGFNFSFSDELKFEASKIELLENQNIIKASGEIKIFLDNETEIEWNGNRTKWEWNVNRELVMGTETEIEITMETNWNELVVQRIKVLFDYSKNERVLIKELKSKTRILLLASKKGCFYG